MESRFVEIEGSRVHYLVAGKGPAVVLLPGLLDWAGRWAEFGYVESLASDYRVVAVDPLGMGDSDRPTDPAALDYRSMIAQIVAVLDALGIEVAHLWGYSAGAQLAAAVAQAHPERVRSLVAGGQVPIFRAGDSAMLEAQAEALLTRGWDGYWEQAPSPAPEALARYRSAVEPHNEPAAFATRLRGMAAPFEAGPPFGGPKLCYVGALEPWIEQARQGMTRLGARFEVIPDADHGGAYRDREAVEPLVRDFLSNA
jgi:pimeloyl-ACP methyl ester carboxylesterase